MRKFQKLFVVIFFPCVVNAQISGTKTIGVDYPTLAAAISALNAQGVAPAGVIINVPAGYTETVPVGGLLLGSNILNPTMASTTPARSIRFIKTGTGANPVLRAFTGGTSTSTDGIFKFLGVDRVSIHNIDFEENPANTGNALMEWGVAFVNLNPGGNIDGCSRDSIVNCKITLNRLNPNTSYGVFSKHITATNASTLLTGTHSDHYHGDILVTGCTISNVTTGIYIDGMPAPGIPW